MAGVRFLHLARHGESTPDESVLTVRGVRQAELGWLVRDALSAPPWRWLGINHAHTGLTTIRYAPGRPAELLRFNDLVHLPAELCWTGFPDGHCG